MSPFTILAPMIPGMLAIVCFFLGGVAGSFDPSIGFVWGGIFGAVFGAVVGKLVSDMLAHAGF